MIKRLGDIASYVNGFAFKPSEWAVEGLPIIRIQDLTGTSSNPNYYNQAYDNKYEINKGDVLISWSASLGVYIWQGEKALLNQHIFKVVFDKGDINKDFFVYQVAHILKKASAQAHGATMRHLTRPVFNSLPFWLPERDKQDKIANILNLIFKLISVREKQIQELDKLIKSRFVEMFGDLKSSCKLARYITGLRSGKSLAGTEVCINKVLKTGAATFGWFDPEQYKYLPIDYFPLPEHRVENGDVMISRMNTPDLVGASSYVFKAPKDMYYPDRLWKVIPARDTNPIFLWQLLWGNEIRKQIKEKSAGTSGTMHNISKARLLEIKSIDVPIQMQNQYANFVLQTYKLKLAVQKNLEKLETLKNSLMQQYFD